MKTYTLENKEVATLLFHMSVMRKAVKKGFKKTYGLLGHKPYMKRYDSVVEKLKALTSNEGETYLLQLDDQEDEMFQNFLKWYVAELEKNLGDQPDEEAEEGLLLLKKIIHDIAITA